MSEVEKSSNSTSETPSAATVVNNIIAPLKPAINNKVSGAVTLDGLIDSIATERANKEIEKRKKTGLDALETYEALRKASNNVRADIVTYGGDDGNEKIESWSGKQRERRNKIREALKKLEDDLTAAVNETDPEKSAKLWDEILPKSTKQAKELVQPAKDESVK